MKKTKTYAIILFLGILCLTACSKKVEQNNTKQAETTPPPIKEYKDDTISCSYNSYALTYQECNPNNNLTYGVYFSNDPSAIKDDIKNGSYIYVATQTHSISYTEEDDWMLPSITKALFNGAFDIESNDTTKVTEISDNIFEYTSQVNDILYYGKLFYMDDSEMTLSACRILPDESQIYKDALKSCYKSIKYIRESDSLEDAEKKAKEAAKSAEEITSGDLYDSIKSIDVNLNGITKFENLYAIYLNSDNPKSFFTSCEKIYKKVFKKNKSITFHMDTKKGNTVATLVVIKNNDSKTFPLHSSLTVFNNKKEKKIKSAYYKNRYWNSLDLTNQNNEEFRKIIKKYSK